MAFGFGGSKSKSKSSGQSSSFDQSLSRGLSGGTSQSQSQQRVAFDDVFARLFGGAEGAAAGLDPSMLTDTANQLFSGGLDFMDQLQGGEDTEFLRGRMLGGTGLLDEQIAGLEEDTGRFFREQLLPGITSDAVAAGGLGGARQGLAQGGAAEATQREFQRGVTALRTADMQDRTQAAQMLGQNRLAGASAGLQNLGTLGNIAQMGFGAELAPYDMLAQIIGGPTVLGESSSSAADFARNFSSSYGRSQASNTSSGDSKSASIGF